VVPKYTESLSRASLKGVAVGVPRDWVQGLEGDVKKSFDASLELMKAEGAKLVDISLPNAKYSLSVYYLLATSEASSNLARFDGVHYGYRDAQLDSPDAIYLKSRGKGFGREVKLRIMLGTYALSAGYYDAFYLKANRVRRKIQDDFMDAFKNVQVIAAPTSPSTAFKLGEKTDDPLTMYLSDIYTLPVNLAGLPGLSLPCGKDAQGLPVGLQLIGKHFDESTLFNVARAYEMARGSFALPRWS
jgi:aspartyl-tRNA(Asn)/glutamyl-tRNA(Gln) amidotransferase subunit A